VPFFRHFPRSCLAILIIRCYFQNLINKELPTSCNSYLAHGRTDCGKKRFPAQPSPSGWTPQFIPGRYGDGTRAFRPALIRILLSLTRTGVKSQSIEVSEETEARRRGGRSRLQMWSNCVSVIEFSSTDRLLPVLPDSLRTHQESYAFVTLIQSYGPLAIVLD